MIPQGKKAEQSTACSQLLALAGCLSCSLRWYAAYALASFHCNECREKKAAKQAQQAQPAVRSASAVELSAAATGSVLIGKSGLRPLPCCAAARTAKLIVLLLCFAAARSCLRAPLDSCGCSTPAQQNS